MLADGFTEQTAGHGRDADVDAVRGLAIITMVAANMAPYSLVAPHPLPLRVYGSFAAPTFIFVSGMMVGGKQRPALLGPEFRRCARLLLVAAAIDVLCWHITPFTTFDVLYLIALATPIAALCRSLPLHAHVLVGLGVLAVTPLLRAWLGYGPLLPGSATSPVFHRLLVDGWFPVFPWLGVALLGAAAGRIRTRIGPRNRIASGAALAGLGLLGLLVLGPVLVTRQGYSELFYPPTISVLCVAIGALLLIHAAFPRIRRRVPLGFLEVYGRASLLLYVTHTVLIVFVLEPAFRPQPLAGFLCLYAGHLAVLWGVLRARGALAERRRQLV